MRIGGKNLFKVPLKVPSKALEVAELIPAALGDIEIYKRSEQF